MSRQQFFKIASVIFVVLPVWNSFAFAQTGPQRVVSVGDQIPQADPLNAFAYYDAATGDIYLAIGEGLWGVVISGAPFAEFNGNFDPNLINTSTPLGAPLASLSQGRGTGWFTDDFDNETLPSGIFNVGRLLPADYRLTTAEAFDELYPEAMLGANGTGIQRPYSTQFRVIQASLAIPEPGSTTIFALTVIFSVMNRRRTQTTK